jgi:hypothetical protein
MTDGNPTLTFEQVVFHEAAARRVRINLLVKPVRPDDEQRLTSRILGISGAGHLVLATPTKSSAQKTFLPLDWGLGLGLAVGKLFVQARSRVLEHCQWRISAPRRVDALLAEMPEKVVSVARRQEVRYEVDPAQYASAAIWLEAELLARKSHRMREGRVANWSNSGLGVRLAAALPFQPGQRVVLRIEGLRGRTCQFYTATLRHCTGQGEAEYLAGFGEVETLGPGQGYPLIHAITHPGEASGD